MSIVAQLIFPCLSGFVGIIGDAVLLFVVFYLVSAIYKRWIRGGPNLKKYGLTERGAAWAIVTGSSDGIGKIFANQLASRGFNVLLLSRSAEKLKAVAEEIEKKYKVKAKFLSVDFSSGDKGIYLDIAKAIKDLGRIGILVNNVGINYPYPTFFLDAKPETDDSIIEVNIKALHHMTRLVLPELVKHKGGAIINLSSFTGIIPSPMLATYSATKAYIDTFSVALSSEYKSQGIDILSISPGLVVSAMSQRSRPNYMQGVVNPGPVVRSALNALGNEQRWCPHPLHAVIETVFSLLPLSKATGFILNLHKDVNRRAVAKLERSKQEKKAN